MNNTQDRSQQFVFSGRNTREISFPIGGIGAGCIGLSGNGSLIDWEIFNRPNKRTYNGLSFFAIKAENSTGVKLARVLHGDLQPPYINYDPNKHHSFGFGVDRESVAGLPHFKDVTFKGEFPMAQLDFHDELQLLDIQLTAFNPFIPLNDDDSSLPVAIFSYDVTNRSNESLDISVVGNLANPFIDEPVNEFFSHGDFSGIKLQTTRYNEEDLEYGNLAITTNGQDVSYQTHWRRGRWFDDLVCFWKEFTSVGKFKPREYARQNQGKAGVYNKQEIALICNHQTLAPSQTGQFTFVIAWHFPNTTNNWNSPELQTRWKNYYATKFDDAVATSAYVWTHYSRLLQETTNFKNALFQSTLPVEVIDAIASNLSVLKSPTCLRLEDGFFYGFEGVAEKKGSCEGTCTHVWNYAYALPFLFPKLERSIRNLEYRYNQREDGGMAFRMLLPLGRKADYFLACADGQFGGVIKTYREWKISGDKAWLREIWPAVKKSIAFAWVQSNEHYWDRDKDGVLEGRQHHSLDTELFGPNTWQTGFYLAALKAGSDMAKHLGEDDVAEQYLALFARGKHWCETHLFNGEYYIQRIDLKDPSMLSLYADTKTLMGDDAYQHYWDEEFQEIKYQIGEGCGIDQVVAQWHANLTGLGSIFNQEQTKSALQSIYTNNFLRGVRDLFNPNRYHIINDEEGTIICSWPNGTVKPTFPVRYAEATMTGFEYQAACHMIQEGLIEEGLTLVRAVRSRYRGFNRNPWNEEECGSNYARSMASYAFLLTFSGFQYNMVEKMIGFDPILMDGREFRSFWCLNTGWGEIHLAPNRIQLHVLYGEIEIHTLRCGVLTSEVVKRVKLTEEDVIFEQNQDAITFPHSVLLRRDEGIEIEY
jgi:non-lysosomal glucosylceramidase